LKTFCCAPISLGRGWRLSCGSNCELIPFFEDSFPVPAAEKPQAPPPYSTSIKEARHPFSEVVGKLQNRRNCPILSFRRCCPEREQLLQQIKTKLDHLAGGGDLFLSASFSYR
jgi:hypothetical protein